MLVVGLEEPVQVITLRSISLVLGIEPWDVVNLVVWHREELVFAFREVRVLVILRVHLPVVRVVNLASKVRVQRRRQHSPTTQVEEALMLLSGLKSAFPPKAFACRFLVLEVRVGIEAYLAMVMSLGATTTRSTPEATSESICLACKRESLLAFLMLTLTSLP